MPTTSPAMIVRGSSTVPVAAEVEPNEDSSAASPGASSSPTAMPTTEAIEADHERLGQHGAQDLAARGAERAQQRELARALGDGDR